MTGWSDFLFWPCCFPQSDHGSIWKCQNCLQQQLQSLRKVHPASFLSERQHPRRLHCRLYPTHQQTTYIKYIQYTVCMYTTCMCCFLSSSHCIFKYSLFLNLYSTVSMYLSISMFSKTPWKHHSVVKQSLFQIISSLLNFSSLDLLEKVTQVAFCVSFIHLGRANDH